MTQQMTLAYMAHSGVYHLVPSDQFNSWKTPALCGMRLHGATALSSAEDYPMYRLCSLCERAQKPRRVFTQTEGHGIFAEGASRPLVEGSPTWVVANDLMRRAETMARVTGSTGSTHIEDDLLGVVVEARWSRDGLKG